ncbi:DUF2252 family protein [Kibdelosporangium aridum]|uniref:DUF2252 family protein n=1 Tax=Kibdelosporangium aridum TaxID=2030 RepID=UPI0035F0F161
MTAEERSAQIADVLSTEFAALIALDRAAFRRKFRKMAASPFAFYRGSACLFYADMTGEFAANDFLDERTRACPQSQMRSVARSSMAW